MNRSLLAYLAVFLGFAALSAWALIEVGYMGVIQVLWAGPGETQVFVDLAIALSISLGFIWPDAKARGISPVPYLLVTLALGSFGPLAYLIRRELGAPGGAG